MNWKILVPLIMCTMFTIETLGAALVEDSQQIEFHCGYGSNIGSNDFTMMNTPHDHKELTYKITSYSNKLSRSIVNNVIAQAFNAWSAVADLKFTKINSGTPDINIKFVERRHGCKDSFDGPGLVLGHASKSYVHFDDSESWSTRINVNVVNLYAIAVHEIGHSLGLGHSTFKESIMYESYNPRIVVTDLHSDDIAGIQELYGAKASSGKRNRNNNGGGVVAGNDCWKTGCQLNTWAVKGCAQYQRTEKSRTACHGGYKYECCSPARPARSNGGSWSECWTTGCQLNSWAVVGCAQYGMTQVEKNHCSGGNKYKCCK